MGLRPCCDLRFDTRVGYIFRRPGYQLRVRVISTGAGAGAGAGTGLNVSAIRPSSQKPLPGARLLGRPSLQYGHLPEAGGACTRSKNQTNVVGRGFDRSIHRRTHRTSNRPAGARSAAESPRDRDHRCLVCAFTVFSERVYELVRSRSQYRYMWQPAWGFLACCNGLVQVECICSK